jgi:hypothetical protein
MISRPIPHLLICRLKNGKFIPVLAIDVGRLMTPPHPAGYLDVANKMLADITANGCIHPVQAPRD